MKTYWNTLLLVPRIQTGSSFVLNIEQWLVMNSIPRLNQVLLVLRLQNFLKIWYPIPQKKPPNQWARNVLTHALTKVCPPNHLDLCVREILDCVRSNQTSVVLHSSGNFCINCGLCCYLNKIWNNLSTFWLDSMFIPAQRERKFWNCAQIIKLVGRTYNS